MSVPPPAPPRQIPFGPFDALAQTIRTANAERGWDVPTRLDDVDGLVLTLSRVGREIYEAMEVLRLTPFDQPHYCEELADVAIYVLDLAAGLAIALDVAHPARTLRITPHPTWGPLHWARALESLTVLRGQLLQVLAGDDRPATKQAFLTHSLVTLLQAMWAAAAHYDEDLSVHIERKCAINTTRPYRHGQKCF